MLDARPREDADELLDSQGVSMEELERSLSDLETANRLLGGRSAIAPHILPFLPNCAEILDIGCGSGDMLRWLSDHGRKSGRRLRLVGVDLNPRVVEIARKRCEDYPDIEIAQADAVSLPFPESSFDLVLSSTFMHHLGPEDVVEALREFDRASRQRVVISDLVRSRIGRISVMIAGSMLFGSLSRYDGVISFQRAYLPEEMLEMAKEAGLSNPRVFAGVYRMILVADGVLPR